MPILMLNTLTLNGPTYSESGTAGVAADILRVWRCNDCITVVDSSLRVDSKETKKAI